MRHCRAPPASNGNHLDVLEVDCRSDTVTRPSATMRRIIKEAEVGDDVFGDCPSVARLQATAAEITGKDAALLVPSGEQYGIVIVEMLTEFCTIVVMTGTMGNLVSILSHCWGRGSAALLGDKSHIFIAEQGGLSQVGIVKPDGKLKGITWCRWWSSNSVLHGHELSRLQVQRFP